MAIAREVAKISVAFPTVDKLFVSVLTERLVANGFTEQRIKDATAYLLDNFRYQKPSIADIISFDKKIKLYSHNDVEILINEDKARFEDFYKHWVGDVLYRVKITEAEQYGLTPYLNQTKP